MTLLETLTADMKTAMKAGEKDKLTTIRMLINEVKNIDLLPNKPTPEQAVEAYGKKLRKTIEEYEKLNQPERVAALKSEMEIVEAYMPRKLDEAATIPLVEQYLSENSFTAKDMGRAMGGFMKLHGDKVEPGVVNKLLKARLADS